MRHKDTVADLVRQLIADTLASDENVISIPFQKRKTRDAIAPAFIARVAEKYAVSKGESEDGFTLELRRRSVR